MDVTQIIAVSVGGFLILLLLFLVFWRRNLTAAEYTFARIVLALAIACVAVLLTGYLSVDFKGAIQAGGALAVFVIVYKLAPAALEGSSEWHDIRAQWRELRDLHDDPQHVNNDDLTRAINAVNSAARAISDDSSLLRPFRTDFKDDYCNLYMKLKTKCYPMPWIGSSSEATLTTLAKKLSTQLGCTL